MEKKSFLTKKNQDRIFIALVLAWPIIHFCIFWFGMNASLLYNSFFTENIMTGEKKFVGFYHYMDFFKIMSGQKDQGRANSILMFWNSFSLIPLILFVNTPLTVLCAFGIFKKIFLHRFFRVVLFIPCIISIVVLTLLFKLAISSQYGIFNEILKLIGLENVIPWGGWLGDEKTAWSTLLVFSVWTGISGNIIYFSSAMSRIPASLIESAELDGASELRQFISVILPIIWPILTTLSVTTVSGVFGWFMPSLLMTSGGPDGATTTIALFIVNSTKSTSPVGYISAFSVIVSVIGGSMVMGLKYIMQKFETVVEF